MSSNLEEFLVTHGSLGEQLPTSLSGERLFPIQLYDFPEERGFNHAWLVLDPKFPKGKAHIRLSKDAILRLPHVDSGGDLCITEDPGPRSKISAEDRINLLLNSFYLDYLGPWVSGKLDADFEVESLNYWYIHVAQHSNEKCAINRIYITTDRSNSSKTYTGSLLQPHRILLAGTNKDLANRFIELKSLGMPKSQVVNVAVAEIPIDCEFTPHTWPSSQSSLLNLIQYRLSLTQLKEFSTPKKRGRQVNQVVILRSPKCNYGFHLSGGSPIVVHRGGSSRAFKMAKMYPLTVERIDPSWTYGRDQISEITDRQKLHIVVFGAGALGSPVISQLAKAGIGRISVVDSDYLSPANIGRHELGARQIGRSKAGEIAHKVGEHNPSVKLFPYIQDAESWLNQHSLSKVDAVVDLTGEPDVREHIEQARKENLCPLIIGWMEPYVAAAHACLLPSDRFWFKSNVDQLGNLEAIDWPEDVIRHEPGCSTQFQSYTSAAAAHAVALVTEGVICLIDNKVSTPVIRSWVRGRKFLDAHYKGLHYRSWAEGSSKFDGVSMERSLHG